MDNIRVYIENTKTYSECAPGLSLKQLLNEVETDCKYPVLVALVDNQLKELGYKIYTPHHIRFIDITHPDARRSYIRSLSFVLQKSVVDLYPNYNLMLDYNLPSGLYGELRFNEVDENGLRKVVKLLPEEIAGIKSRMAEYIKKDLPFVKTKLPFEEAARIFLRNRREEKAEIVQMSGKFFVSTYNLDGYTDTFYGPLLNTTGAIHYFDLHPYDDGFCLQYPNSNEPEVIKPIEYHEKLSEVFSENSKWLRIMGARGIGSVNNTIRQSGTIPMIQIAESLHERKYTKIADKIFAKRDRVKIVLIAGPSSSGKTTTSKRISLQMKTLGMNPVILEMDNYFVNREKTPRDEKGDYDFESIYAMDLHFLNKQLKELLEGKEVEIPKFDFVNGERLFTGNKISLKEKDILVMEGIHALNPILTSEIPDDRKFKIYASALTSLSIDENNNISTSDNRLMRRIVRDCKTRGITPEQTILRWPSVRAGEEKNIFPFQENADIMFNSSLIFEIPVLKYYVEPLLIRITPASPAYPESKRLLKFLSYIVQLTPSEIEKIPPTSVLREFIGGSSFE